jgi:outer membrane lipoprotein-sorting protein
MLVRAAFTVPLFLCLTAGVTPGQPPDAYLSVMDKFSRTFTGAKASIQSIVHTQSIPEDDVETGTFFVKRSGGKTEFRIDFTDPNVYSVAVRNENAEIYHPKLNEIDVYDLRAYKDVAQKLFLLGFGMPGNELAANYEIQNVKHDTVDGQASMHLELIPKSPDVKKQLKSIEVWISDTTMCPVRQTFHMPDGSSRTAQFSAMEVDPKFPSGTFDLPKGAKRVRAN